MSFEFLSFSPVFHIAGVRYLSVSNLGLGDAPYTQNMVESVNDLIKDWRNFTAQDMDKLVVALYEVIASFDEEEELAWFGLSEKWEVKVEYQHLRPMVSVI